MSAGPDRAMVLAAGRGERMRPLSDATPKPLIELAGKPLIDHALDRLAAAGVGTVVVNVCYRADAIARHLAGRRRPRIELSRESEPLDTGGGVANALARLGARPFYVVNGDVLWFDGVEATLARLAAAWDDARMDALLLLVLGPNAVGYGGKGDFFLGPLGEVRRRGERETAPYVFGGVQMLHPRLFEGCPEGPFSLNLLYDRAAEADRLRGLVHDGEWMHVGTPEALAEAEHRLDNAAATPWNG